VSDIHFYNSLTGKTEKENVYGEAFLSFAYGNPLGKMALHALIKRHRQLFRRSVAKEPARLEPFTLKLKKGQTWTTSKKNHGSPRPLTPEKAAALKAQIDKLVDLQLENPEHVALRRAIRAVPELTAADEKSNAAFAQAIDFALRSVLPEMDARRTRSVARTVVEAGTALIEYCAMHPKEARGMSREIGVMVVGYVREVLKSA
jgi:hypothetical protein